MNQLPGEMNLRYLLFFLFVHAFAAQAQKDSVYLADIQSSECGGSYYVSPHFLSKQIIGDTTYLTLSCTNNCNGYNNPRVTLKDDSVKIAFGYGLKTIRYLLRSGQYIDSAELNKYPKDSILIEQTESIAMCDCCYNFNLKILGLDSTTNYKYFYNENFIDPDYKDPPTRTLLNKHFLNEPSLKVLKKIKRILESEKLLELFKKNELIIDLTMDTLTCSFKKITANFYVNDKHTKSAERKLAKYFVSLTPSCVFSNNTNRIIEEFLIIIDYLGGEWEIDYRAKEEVYHTR